MIRVLAILILLTGVWTPAQAFNFSIGGMSIGSKGGDNKPSLDLRQVKQGFRLISALIPISDKDEIKIGRSVAKRVIKRFGLAHMEKQSHYLNLLGTAIAQHSDRPDLPYHFAILDTDDVNAYACPGGFVFVTRGAMAMVQDEAELAAILSHEIAHVTERHIIKALQHSKAMKIGAQIAAEALAHGAGAAFDQMINAATDSLFKGLKKGDEYDSDKKGVEYLDRIGYDYPAMIDLLHLLDKRRKAGQAKILAVSHPLPKNRIRALKSAEKKMHMEDATHIRLSERFIHYTQG